MISIQIPCIEIMKERNFLIYFKDNENFLLEVNYKITH